jgi:oxygen-dependent protoporphyrinogen oxidase
MAKGVVIAGGGISGLALAWALRRRGMRARVFEPASRPGGKLQSDRVDGFLVEYGPQGFGFRDPAARALVDDLGLGPQLVQASDAARRRCVLVEGELREVPVSALPFARSGIAPVGTKARLLLDLALPRGTTARGGDESVASFGRRRFGERGAERLFFPLVSGLYSGDPEVLSLPAAFPSLARLERESRSVLLGALRSLRAGVDGPRLASFREGIGTLALALAAKLGSELELGVAVADVRPAGSGWRVVLDEGGRRRELDCDAVALTMPAHAVGAVVGGVEPAVAAIVGRIPYAPVVMVHLGYRCADVPRLPHAYGFYAPSSEPSRLLGAVFTSEIFPSHAPAGTALVACRMGGAREPGLLGQ